MAEKVSRDRGYRSDTIAISRDMGPLRRHERMCREMGHAQSPKLCGICCDLPS